MVGVAGVIFTEASEEDVTETVVVPVMPFRVAVTFTGPVFFFVQAKPVPPIFARLAEDVCHWTPLSGLVLPSLNTPIAVN
jgi:hypothetical protein